MCASGQGYFLKIFTPLIWETSSLVSPRYFSFNEKRLYFLDMCTYSSIYFLLFFYSCLQQYVNKGPDGNQTGLYFLLNNINEVQGFFCFIYLKPVLSAYFVEHLCWSTLDKVRRPNKSKLKKKQNTEFQDQKRTNRLPMDFMLLAVTHKEVQSHVILMYPASLLGSQNPFLL